ncbi:MAG: hypothetical protein U7127_03970 [Phormidium sp.]
MQALKEQISRNLIVYQREVDLKLRELYNQGLLSKSDIEELKIDVELTGKAVLQTFESPIDYPDSVLKIYVDNLFDKYRSEVEAKIAAIERKRLKTHQQQKEQDRENKKQANLANLNVKKNIFAQVMNCMNWVAGQVMNWCAGIGQQNNKVVKKRDND